MGPCPCKGGTITVERCSPDHPWAKRFWFRSTLVCKDCEEEYGFFSSAPDKPARLVLKIELKKREESSQNWHMKLREIESSQAFKELSEKLDARLGQERSAAARHRVLVHAGLATGMSLLRYRKQGHRLRTGEIEPALKLLGIQSTELESKALQAKRLWNLSELVPGGIETGIHGLEM